MKLLRPNARPLLLALTLALMSACSEDPLPNGTDTQPPARIADLAAMALDDSTITLTWTAPGDDGDQGTATAYDIRVALSAAALDSFGVFRPVYSGQPRSAGRNETLNVTHLARATRHYFAVAAVDESDNTAPRSNLATSITFADTIPPAAILDVRIEAVTATTMTVRWTSPGDDGDVGRATHYDLRYSRDPITADNFDLGSPAPTATRPSPSHLSDDATIGGLTPRTTYYVAIRTMDEVGNLSSLSNSPRRQTDRAPQDWIVRLDGTGDAPTIQAAIDSARNGETVRVMPGVYFENITFAGKNLTVTGVEGAHLTTIDGGRRSDSVVRFDAGEDTSAVLEHLTITNGGGHGFPQVGGGIYISNSQPTIRSCRIVKNGFESVHGADTQWGGGVFARAEHAGPVHTPRLQGCFLSTNRARDNGGGIGVLGAVKLLVSTSALEFNEAVRGDGGGAWGIFSSGGFFIQRTVFRSNVARDHGGGINAAGPSDGRPLELLISESVFHANRTSRFTVTSDGGSGVCLSDISGSVTSNTFAQNMIESSDSKFGSAMSISGASLVTVANNIFAFNIGLGALGCAEPAVVLFEQNLFWANQNQAGQPSHCHRSCPGCPGHLQVDPQFCDLANGDLRVRAGSPALYPVPSIGAFPEPGCPP